MWCLLWLSCKNWMCYSWTTISKVNAINYYGFLISLLKSYHTRAFPDSPQCKSCGKANRLFYQHPQVSIPSSCLPSPYVGHITQAAMLVISCCPWFGIFMTMVHIRVSQANTLRVLFLHLFNSSMPEKLTWMIKGTVSICSYKLYQIHIYCIRKDMIHPSSATISWHCFM